MNNKQFCKNRDYTAAFKLEQERWQKCVEAREES